MDQQGSRPPGPVGDVLFLPELLEKILDFCSHADQKQLLNCRLVCSFWRDCAFSVFANNLSIVPSLSLRNPRLLEWSVEPNLLKFCEKVKPPSSLPVIAFMKYNYKLADSSCGMLPAKFLQEYSPNILGIYSCDLVFDYALEITQFPHLRKLVIESFRVGKVPVQNLRNYFKTTAHRLVELNLNLRYSIQLGEMPNLKTLRLGPAAGAGVYGTEALAKLLPNLNHIWFGKCMFSSRSSTTVVKRVTETGAKFLNVVHLVICDSWSTTKDDSELMVGRLVDCFPNTKKLYWCSDMPSSPIFTAIQMVFSSLSCLTVLRLACECSTAQKICRMLTNLSVEDIPNEEEHWEDTLIDTSKTLCNLKLLRSFALESRGRRWRCTPVELLELESRFLLKAVFMKMETLQKISFSGIRYDAECIRAWRGSGREFETIS